MSSTFSRQSRMGVAAVVVVASLAWGVFGSAPTGAAPTATAQPGAAAIQPRSAASFDDTFVFLNRALLVKDDSPTTQPNPATVAVDFGDDTVYVANAWSGTVEVLSPGQISGPTSPRVNVNTIVAVAPPPSFPSSATGNVGLYGIAVNSPDDTIYVVNRSQSPRSTFIWAINGRTMTVDDTEVLNDCLSDNPSAGYTPAYHTIAVDSSNDTVYVPCLGPSGKARILAVNGATLTVDDSYTTAGSYTYSGVAVTPSGKVLVSGWDGSAGAVTVFGSGLNEESTWTTPFAQPAAVVVGDDTAYVSSYSTTALWGRNLNSSATVSVTLDASTTGWQALAYRGGSTPMVFVGSQALSGSPGIKAVNLRNLSATLISGVATSSIVVTSRDLVYGGNDYSTQYIYKAVQVISKVPNVPAAPVGTAGDGQVPVTWTAPASGIPITNYKVVASPGGASCTVLATSCTIAGLTNGTAYTFKVQAQNAAGWSSLSAASAPITPAAPPPPPPPIPVANMQLTVASSPARFEKAGDVLTITATVLNTGTDSLNTVQVKQGSIPLSCMPATPVAWLAPGSSIVCRGTHVVTEEDVDASVVRDRITATAVAGLTGAPLSAVAVLEVPGPPPPERLQLRVVMNSTPGNFTRKGEKLSLTALVSNTGNVPVRDLVITGSPTDFFCTPSSPVRSLAVKGTMRCSGTYEVTKADMSAGTIRGLIRATGSSSSGARIASTGAVEVYRTSPERPSLKVSITSSPDSFRRVGQVLTFTAVVANRGDVALTDVIVTGRPVTLACTPPSPLAVLEVDTKVTCTGRHTVTQADMKAGVIRVTAGASGTTAKGNSTSDNASMRVRLDTSPRQAPPA